MEILHPQRTIPEALPPVARRFFDRHTPALIELGFEPVADYRMKRTASFYSRYFMDRDRTVVGELSYGHLFGIDIPTIWLWLPLTVALTFTLAVMGLLGASWDIGLTLVGSVALLGIACWIVVSKLCIKNCGFVTVLDNRHYVECGIEYSRAVGPKQEDWKFFHLHILKPGTPMEAALAYHREFCQSLQKQTAGRPLPIEPSAIPNFNIYGVKLLHAMFADRDPEHVNPYEGVDKLFDGEKWIENTPV